MPRATPAHLEWQTQNPSPCVARGIWRRVNAERDWIQATWGLDDTPDSSGESDLDRAVTDIADQLFKVWLHLRITGKTASVAQQRVNLRAFLERGVFTRAALELLDPATQATIANRHPDGPYAFQLCDDPVAIEQAVTLAIEFLGPSKRGRDKLGNSVARQQFALFLATQYYEFARVAPSRTYNPATSREEGPFPDFVGQVMARMPRMLWPIHHRPDALIRFAIEAFHEARGEAVQAGPDNPSHVNPIRLWNTDPKKWLGTTWGN